MKQITLNLRLLFVFLIIASTILPSAATKLSGCQSSRSLCYPFIFHPLHPSVPKEALHERLNVAIGNSTISSLGSLRRSGWSAANVHFFYLYHHLFCDYFSLRHTYRLPKGVQNSSQFLLQQTKYKECISCLVMALSSPRALCLLGSSIGPIDSLGRSFAPSVLEVETTICFNL